MAGISGILNGGVILTGPGADDDGLTARLRWRHENHTPHIPCRRRTGRRIHPVPFKTEKA